MSKRSLLGLSFLAAVSVLLITVVLVFGRDSVSPPLPEIAWQVGGAQSYETSIESKILLELPGSLGQQLITQRVSGILNLRVFDVQPDEVRAGFQLSPVSYELSGEHNPQIESGLSTPFIAVFGPQGDIRAFEFQERLGKIESTILAEALRTFEVVLPAGDRVVTARRHRSWEVAEAHATGRYLADYQIGDDGRIQKQKTQYIEVDPAFGEVRPTRGHVRGAQRRLKQLGAELVRSVAVLWLGDGVSWLQSANVDERVIVRSGQDTITDSSVWAELELREELPRADLALMEAGSWSDVLASAATTPADAAPQLTEEERAARLREQRERLAKLIDALNGEQARSIAVLQGIVQMLLEAPELAFDVERALQAPELTAAAEPRLIHALAMAGTVESQHVLTTMTEDSSQPSFNRLRAIVALGGVEEATEASFDALVRMSEAGDSGETRELANTALLAIGGIGASLQMRNSPDASKVSAYLEQTLLTSSTDRELEIALKAIGNTRDVGFEDAILPYLEDTSPVVRASAAETLGKLHADGSFDALVQQLEVEPDPGVRASIAAGIYESGETSVDAMMLINSRIADEPRERARYNMTRFLGENLELYPEAIETLSQLARTDGSKRVRGYASSVMLQTRAP